MTENSIRFCLGVPEHNDMSASATAYTQVEEAEAPSSVMTGFPISSLIFNIKNKLNAVQELQYIRVWLDQLSQSGEGEEVQPSSTHTKSILLSGIILSLSL